MEKCTNLKTIIETIVCQTVQYNLSDTKDNNRKSGN